MIKISNVTGKADLAIYIAIAFPFVLQLVPGFDTQPTFVLLALFAFVCIPAIRAQMLTELARIPLQVIAVLLLVFGLFVSILASEEIFFSMRRVTSFALFLFALMYGLARPNIITQTRLRYTLFVYAAFTLVFFVTQGAIEAALISSRGDAIGTYVAVGRGASTLSPEPSFFAIQIASLFLLYFLSQPPSERESYHTPLVIGGVALLLSTLSGYGALYVILLGLTLDRRLTVVIGMLALAIIILFSEVLDVRIIRLINLAREEGLLGMLVDASIAARLESFFDYLNMFADEWMGNGFQRFAGGGLVSVLAGLGIFSIPMFILLLTGLLRLGERLPVMGLAAGWVTLTVISNPVGVPLVGILVGQIMRRATLTRVKQPKADIPAPRVAGVMS